MVEKLVSVQRMAEIAESYMAKQLPDTAGMHIASMYRCIAVVFREAAKSEHLAGSYPRKGQIGNE